jgi:hypothetical protein
MRKTLLVLVVFILVTLPLAAEIIDRIAAVVNNHIITLGDLRREREIRAVLGSTETKEDKAILGELIDAQIIADQIEQFPGIEISEEEIRSELGRHPDLRGLDPALIRDSILRRLRTAEFFQVRFRQFLRATDAEVSQYYATVFLPGAEKRGLKPVPTLQEMTEGIRSSVIEEKVQHDVDNWLDAIRRRSSIEVFQ